MDEPNSFAAGAAEETAAADVAPGEVADVVAEQFFAPVAEAWQA